MPHRKPPSTPEDVARWRKLREQGISVNNIALRAGRQPSYIYQATGGVETGPQPPTAPRGAGGHHHRRRGGPLAHR